MTLESTITIGNGNSTDVDEDSTTSYKDLPDYLSSVYILTYGGFFIIVFGIIGNILSICVLRRQTRKMTSAKMYLLSLASVDLAVIVVGQLTRHWIRGLTGIDTINLNEWWCKIWFVLIHGTKTCSGFILAAASTERCLVMWRPLRAKTVSTKKFACITISLITIGSFSVYIHYLWSYGPTYKTVGNTTIMTGACTVSHDYPGLTKFMLIVRPWTDFAIRCAIPFLIIIISNSLMIAKLVKVSRQREALGLSQAGKNKNSMTSLATVLIILSVAYLLLTSPMQIMYLVDRVDPFGSETIGASAAARSFLLWTIAFSLYFLNHCKCFVMFCAMGGQFRKDLKNLIKTKWRHTPCIRRSGEDDTFGTNIRDPREATVFSITNVRPQSSRAFIGGTKTKSVARFDDSVILTSYTRIDT